MRRSPSGFTWWSLTLASACLWDLSCSFTSFDLRESVANSCLRYKLATTCSARQAGYCIAPATVIAASPRWLSGFAGNFGPLVMWVPMLLAATGRRHSASSPSSPTSTLLCTTLAWYLFVIGPVRHMHRLLSALGHAAPWDPSGHVIVYASQLLPLWVLGRTTLTRSAMSVSAGLAQAWCSLWTAVLWYLSFTTGAFFHTCSETIAAWMLAVVLLAALAQHRELLRRTGALGGGGGGGDDHGGDDDADSSDGATSSSVAEAEGALARWEGTLHGMTWLVVLPEWALVTAAAWHHAMGAGKAAWAKEQPLLVGMLCYDAGLWLMSWWLGGGPCERRRSR